MEQYDRDEDISARSRTAEESGSAMVKVHCVMVVGGGPVAQSGRGRFGLKNVSVVLGPCRASPDCPQVWQNPAQKATVFGKSVALKIKRQPAEKDATARKFAVRVEWIEFVVTAADIEYAGRNIHPAVPHAI